MSESVAYAPRRIPAGVWFACAACGARIPPAGDHLVTVDGTAVCPVHRDEHPGAWLASSARVAYGLISAGTAGLSFAHEGRS
jgi:hypothetical protein